MKLLLAGLVALAAASVSFAAENVQYVYSGGKVSAVAIEAPAVQVTQTVAAPVRTRTVMVKQCTTDSFGNTTCRLVPRLEVIPDAPQVVQVAVPTVTAASAPSASCQCVATLGYCPCVGQTAATVSMATVSMTSEPVTVSESLAAPRLHSIRNFLSKFRIFKNRAHANASATGACASCGQ